MQVQVVDRIQLLSLDSVKNNLLTIQRVVELYTYLNFGTFI